MDVANNFVSEKANREQLFGKFSTNDVPKKVSFLTKSTQTVAFATLLKTPISHTHIPYSVALRLRRICSTDEFFKHCSAELQAYLTKRGYKWRFIRDQISRAKQIPRKEALREQKQASKDTSDRVPFTITYNPALPNIQDILRRKQPSLHSTERLKNIFKEAPVVAFRHSPNRRDLLVRAKLASTNKTPKLPAGTFCSGSKHGCLTCPFIENGRTSCTFTNTGETRQIRHRITCNSTNLTYMIECKKCNKQYIDETKRTLRERFSELRQATSNPLHANAAAPVPSHFNLPGHSMTDMGLIALELQPTPSASRRKGREA